MNPDGEDWRRGYDNWKTDAPDTGAGGYEDRPCAVCGSARKKYSRECASGHTPAEQDAAAKAKRGW